MSKYIKAAEDLGGERTPELEKAAQTISLLDLIMVVLKHKVLILALTLTGAGLSLLFAIGSILLPQKLNYLPNTYTASALIMLKSPSGGSAGTTSSLGDLSGLAALAGFSIGSEADLSSSIVMSLMEQNTFMDQLASDLDFSSKYKLKPGIRGQISSRNIIKKKLRSEYFDATGILSLEFIDIDKEFAARVVNQAVELLKERFNSVTLQYGREKLSIITESIETARKNLKDTQTIFSRFQTKYGFYDLEISTASSLKVLEEAGASLLDYEAQYKSLSSYRSANDPQLIRLAQQIDQQKSFIKSLKQGGNGLSSLNVPIDDLPMVVSEYLILKGELTIQQSIYASLRQQYESTQIEEISGSKIFSVLEKAEVPNLKSGPRRSLIIVLTTMACFFLSIIFAFIKEYIGRVSADPEEAVKLTEIKKLAFSWGKRRR